MSRRPRTPPPPFPPLPLLPVHLLTREQRCTVNRAQFLHLSAMKAAHELK